MFMPGMFTNSANATPDQIAQKRAMLMAMMPKFGSANYVGEGLGQLATGIAYGRQFRGMDKQEAAGRQSAADRFKALLGGGAAQPGAFNVLGQPPADPMSPEAIGADTMAALGKGPLTQDAVVSELVKRGMPEHAALGFAMNFKDESGFDPAAVGDNGNAFGLGQWNGPRKKALFDYAANQGKNPADPQVQYDYLMTELQGPESGAWAKIAGTNDPNSAAVAVLNHFERPAEEHRARREAAYMGGQQPSGQQGSQIGIDQLYAAMADPWMGPEQKAILQSMIADRQKQTDPAYQLGLQADQLGLEKAQLEVDALRNPKPEPIKVGDVLLDPTTMQPIYDGRTPKDDRTSSQKDYSFYVADERKAGRQPLSFNEWELQGKKAGAANTTVTVGGEPSDGALRKKLSEKEGEGWAAYLDAGNKSAGTMQDMQLLDELITMAPQGPVAGRLASMFPGVNSAADAFTSVVKRVAPTLRATGSGSTSDIEYDGMLKSLPQLASTPEANTAIAAMMKAKAQVNIDRAQIISRYQNGEISAVEARNAVNEIDKRSIMTPELKAILGNLKPSDAAVPEGVDPSDWEYMTPEERAMFQ